MQFGTLLISGMHHRRLVNRRGRGAFTMLELLVTLVVIAILAALAFQAFRAMKQRAEKARCIGNLRTLHTAFDGYILDKNRWPQMPAEAIDYDESQFFGWWVKELEPYGAGQESWVCPSDKVVKEASSSANPFFAGSYIPTMFDAHDFTPFRWNQPWLMERGAFHAKKGHVLMPDGSVRDSLDPLVGGN